MAIDNDLSALLPDPPPPRPARRDAAIEEAMRRFDGGGAQPPRPAVEEPRGPAREIWRRPQVAVLASAALVMLVGVPVWLAQKDGIVARGSQAPAEAVQAERRAVAAPGPEQGTPEQRAAASPAASAEVADTDGLAEAPPARFAPAPAEMAVAPAPELIVTAQSRRDERASSPRPVTAVAQAPPARARTGPDAELADNGDEGNSIIVTGSSVSRRNYESSSPIVTRGLRTSRGEWNICTMHDPNRDAGACKAFADPAAEGRAGRAGRGLADGLRFVWQGRLDQAIDAFGSAIEAKPDLAIAYVNRGLVYQEKREFGRAVADFDRAVAREPRNARGYFYRSLAQRALRNEKRAAADAKRAVELDPRYKDLLR